ncbi:hypothetical protein NQ318_009416 [Aromia moschata]|uniref:Uncharacterized protein n=1 Tax=Aromia moschata TaxID=1265417 RepID=A0AAV8Z8V0_9CUCU|nr:hypothetical protein NQ318_009416 [Aromia moschata]
MTEEVLANEIGALKDQIANLKAAINTLSSETEQKEIAIAKLAREKEQLHLDLLKRKRSNVNLAQQLEEERKFYFKEKEIYCQEMNECKKLKRLMSSSSAISGEEKNFIGLQAGIIKAKADA